MSADARRLYQGGGSIRSIAARLGRSYGFTRTLLVNAGVALRPPGHTPRPAAEPDSTRPAVGTKPRHGNTPAVPEVGGTARQLPAQSRAQPSLPASNPQASPAGAAETAHSAVRRRTP
ncbi:helix-turn-helix domain-containing protein [Actinoplanes sp. CA-131856]